jgi:hypothetical protein
MRPLAGAIRDHFIARKGKKELMKFAKRADGNPEKNTKIAAVSVSRILGADGGWSGVGLAVGGGVRERRGLARP